MPAYEILRDRAHAQWRRCELFGTASYLILHRDLSPKEQDVTSMQQN